LLERVGAPLFPFASIGVVAALEGLGVDVFRVLQVGTAAGADIAELAILAHFHLVFVDVPVLFKTGLFEGFPEGGVPDVARSFTDFDVAYEILFIRL
jgi:hypothetical protein